MKEFARLLILVVIVVPLGLLFIGPLLILAALRGVQRIGPIVLSPGRGGVAARGGAFLLGSLAWLAVWGGLVLLLTGFGPSNFPLRAEVLPSPTPLIPTVAATPLPSPASTDTPTPSPQPVEPVPSPSPTPSPAPPAPTPTLPVPTPTSVPATPTPLPTATFTPGPPPSATLAPELASEAIAAVEAANELLRQAAMEPSLGNLAALEAAWQDRALARAQAFAQDLYQQYRRALEISFVYLGTPTALEGDTPGTAIVTSTEVWTYTTSLSSRSEAFDFIYTLERRDAGWVITNYTYRNAPDAIPPLPVETRGVVTGTNVLTATTPITSPP